MIPFLFSVSIVAAFFGGVIAFLAPCCVTVLLPAYFAYMFKRRSAILKMTFIFMLGIAIVLLPIALGLSALAQVFNQFHKEILYGGGIFLLILGVLSIMGKMLPIPHPTKVPAIQLGHVAPIFGLGVFSGFASACCVPVLAGVLTLTTLGGSFLAAFTIGWAYIFGLVFPLLLIALFWDRYKLEKKGIIAGKLLTFNAAGRTFYINSTNLASGVVLISVGIIILYLAFMNYMTLSPVNLQVAFTVFLQSAVSAILNATNSTLDAFIATGIFILVALLIWWSFKRETNVRSDTGNAVKVARAERDPVCGMKVDRKSNIKKTYGGKTYHFCSVACRNKFEAKPHKFTEVKHGKKH